jgi:hypothetical protein
MSTPGSRKAVLVLGIFFLSFSLYLLSYSGNFHSSDEVSMYAVTESLAQRGEFQINKIAWMHRTETQVGRYGVDGNTYSYHSVAQSLAGIPLYLVAVVRESVGNVQTVMLTNSLVTSLTNALLFLLVLRLGYSAKVGVGMALLHGFASLAWPYAKTFFSEPLGALLMVAALYVFVRHLRSGGDRSLFALGTLLGILAVVKMAYLVVAPVFLMAVAVAGWRERGDDDWLRWARSALAFGLPIALALALLGMYNQLRFGSPLETGYPSLAFKTSFVAGLSGLLFSPGRGLLFYSPVVILGLIGIPVSLRRNRIETWTILAILIVYIGFFSKWYVWWRGVNWGPRYLLPIVPLLVLLAAPTLENAFRRRRWPSRILAGALMGISFAIQLAAVAANYLLYSIHLREAYPDIETNLAPLYDPRLSPLFNQFHLLWPLQTDLALWDQAGARDLALVAAIAAAVLFWAAAIVAALRSAKRSAAAATLSLLLLGGLASSALLGQSLLLRSYTGPGEDYRDLTRMLAGAGKRQDAIVAVTPYHYHMNHYKLSLPVYGLELMPRLPSESSALLEKAMSGHPRLWLVTAGLPPSDPGNDVERMLNQTAFKATDEWVGRFRLCLFGSPKPDPTSDAEVVNASIGNAIQLESYRWNRLPSTSGDMGQLCLNWKALSPIEEDYTVFVHLVGEDGRLWAQRDTWPGGGYRPTSTWSEGERIEDRLGLLLVPEAPEGRYTVAVGMYRSDGSRLPVSGPGAQFEEGYILLPAIDIGREPSP